MYVILISAYFFHKPIGMEFPHFLERFLEVFLDAVHEDFSSVSGDPHNVILRFVHCVGLAMELHASIVSWGSRMRLPAHTPTLTGGVSIIQASLDPHPAALADGRNYEW